MKGHIPVTIMPSWLCIVVRRALLSKQLGVRKQLIAGNEMRSESRKASSIRRSMNVARGTSKHS